MEHIKYIRLKKDIQIAKSTASLKSPLFIFGVLIWIAVLIYALFLMPNISQAQKSIEALTTNQTYIGQLATNSSKLIQLTINNAAAIQQIQVGIFAFIILMVSLAGYFIFLLFSKLSETNMGVQKEIKRKILEKGYTQKDIDEYIKGDKQEIIL